MPPTHSTRARGAQIAVMALGSLSAIALIGASLSDFGDPVATARAQAQQQIRSEVAEVRLAWDEARTREGAPPGAGQIVNLSEGLNAHGSLEFGPSATSSDSQDQEPGPLTRAYFELGQRALLRGDAAAALASFTGGLAEAAPEARGYRDALFGALRAAGTLGDIERVQQLRRDLFELPDKALDGTSLQLLAALVPPMDSSRAHARLMSDLPALPAPSDRVALVVDSFRLLPDPWWNAVRTQLAQDQGVDGEALFRTQERLKLALRNQLKDANILPKEAWSIVDLLGGWIAVRERASATEVAAIQPETLASELLGDAVPAPLQVRVGVHELAEPDSTPLPGSPFGVTVTHRDPEGAATRELRRLRILRFALVGLGLLVLLAALLSARAMGRTQQLSELRSTFVASVSHDLRTPTQAILLMAQTLEQSVVEAPEGRARYHTQIRKEAQRLRRLVEDLLDGARIDRGDGARVERRNVPAKAYFDELQAALEERASSAGAQMEVDIAELPATLHVDPDGLYRCVWNLFENALRYGHGEDQAAEVRVTAQAVGPTLEVEVSDAGPGIPQQHQRSIFSPFERVPRARAEPAIHADTGTGLGLAIVRAICVAHGGSVELKSSTVGARFVLSLPMLPPEGDAP